MPEPCCASPCAEMAEGRETPGASPRHPPLCRPGLAGGVRLAARSCCLNRAGGQDLWLSQVPVSIVQPSVNNDHPPGHRAHRVSLRTPVYAGCPSSPTSLYLVKQASCLSAPPFGFLSLPPFSKATVRPHCPQGLTPRRQILYPSCFTFHLLF